VNVRIVSSRGVLFHEQRPIVRAGSGLEKLAGERTPGGRDIRVGSSEDNVAGIDKVGLVACEPI